MIDPAVEFFRSWLAMPFTASAAVLGLFWSIDDALSDSARREFSKKIKNITSSSNKIPSLDIIEQVFSKTYKVDARGLPSIIRVSGISTLFILLCFLLFTLEYSNYFEVLSNLRKVLVIGTFPFILFLAINFAFDYFSAIKAVFIMRKLVITESKVKTTVFILSDFLFTIILVLIYGLISLYIKTNTNVGYAFEEANIFTVACLLSTFITVCITLLFAISKDILKYIFYNNNSQVPNLKPSMIRKVFWYLPTDTRPCRAIGLVSAVIVFVSTLIVQIIIRLI